MQIRIDGEHHDVPAGMTVAAALALSGDVTTRTSVTGQRRAPVCGMGVCQECRVLINGVRRLACQTVCCEGMDVDTRSALPVAGEL